MQGSDLGSFYKPMSIGFIARCNCAHFPDLNLDAQSAYFRPPYSIKIWSLFLSKSGSLVDPDFKAQRCLNLFWAVQMIKIVFVCCQFQQTKTALLLNGCQVKMPGRMGFIENIVPASKKECLAHHR